MKVVQFKTKTPYKSDQPEANVKTNCTCNAKRTHPKERYFATNYLNFLKIKCVYEPPRNTCFYEPTTKCLTFVQECFSPGSVLKSEDYIENYKVTFNGKCQNLSDEG